MAAPTVYNNEPRLFSRGGSDTSPGVGVGSQ